MLDDKKRQEKTREEKTRQDKRRQDKRRQDKARQDKARQQALLTHAPRRPKQVESMTREISSAGDLQINFRDFAQFLLSNDEE